MWKNVLMVCWLSWQCAFLSINLAAQEMTPATRNAIEKGLQFLAKQQDPQGFWRSNVGYKLNTDYQVTRWDKPHVGVTALACMAFMASGNLPDRGRYGANIAKGIDFIISCVHPETGYISRYNTRMYSHAFATLCLAEVSGMSNHTKKLRNALERAIHLIVACQNAQGGWRYEPNAQDSDMSITVCQVQALRAARNIGLRVPKKSIERAIDYIRHSASYQGGFYYQVAQVGHARVSFALTAAGVTALYGAGLDTNDRDISRGLEYLLRPPSRDPHPPANHYFYYYGHYYAIQAMYMAGGRYWTSWYPHIRNELIANQKLDGSWEDNVGKIFATSVGTLILQVPYRYLPILQR